MTSLPLWAVFTIGFGSPLLAFCGVVLTQRTQRHSAATTEIRSRREETMRILRWAAQLAVDRDDRLASLGVEQLATLLESDLLDDADKGFIEAALHAVYQDPQANIEAWGHEAQVFELPGSAAQNPDAGAGDVSSTVHTEWDGGDDDG